MAGAVAVAGLLVACGGDGQATGERISSTARLEIVEPSQGAVITGDTMTVRLSLEGGSVVPAATTDLKPDEGHIHTTLDGELFSMTYGLEQQVPVSPGVHRLQVEYVAGDHAPFNPRVIVVRRIEVR